MPEPRTRRARIHPENQRAPSFRGAVAGAGAQRETKKPFIAVRGVVISV